MGSELSTGLGETPPVTVIRLGAFAVNSNCEGVASFLVGLDAAAASGLVRCVEAFGSVQSLMGEGELCNVVIKDGRGQWLAADDDAEEVPYTGGENGVGVLPPDFEVPAGVRMKDRVMTVYRHGVAWGAVTDDRDRYEFASHVLPLELLRAIAAGGEVPARFVCGPAFAEV